MYIDTMQQVFANTSKVYVDTKSGSNLLYLPLDKLIQQSGDARAAAPAAAPAERVESAPAQPAEAARTRETLRSRDRETGR
jgi:membrane protease subunit HflK